MLAAQAAGADFAYIGSAFIATREARAVDGYKQMVVGGTSRDIVYSNLFTGVHGNYLRGSIAGAGLDPDALPASDPSAMNFGTDRKKPWKDIWGCGQGIAAIDAVVPAADLVARLQREYRSARQTADGDGGQHDDERSLRLQRPHGVRRRRQQRHQPRHRRRLRAPRRVGGDPQPIAGAHRLRRSSNCVRHGGAAEGYSADVRDAAAVADALKQAHARFGPIDVLVSGAAGNFLAPALGMSANGFKTVVDIDLLGSFNVLRGAHEFLRKPGASVISISASQAFVPTPYQAHVCAAKAGVDMLTHVLAMEWGGDGIRVNSIVPGPIEGTEGIRRLAPNDEERARMTDARAAAPLRQPGRHRRHRDGAELAARRVHHRRRAAGGRRHLAVGTARLQRGVGGDAHEEN